MTPFFYPIMALLVAFLCFLSTLRFLFSRQGLFWIIPSILSAFLSYLWFMNLFFPGSFMITFIKAPAFPLFASLLWYAVIISFHYATKKKNPRNRYRDDARKNLYEARYIEKMERRAFVRIEGRRKILEMDRQAVPHLDPHKNQWIELFDKR